MDEEEIIEGSPEDSSPSGPSRREIKRQQDEENATNNAKAIKATSAILKNTGEPISTAIGHGIDIADKVTGGRSTKALGHGLNKMNKRNLLTPVPGGGKLLQKGINAAGKSGATDAIGQAANAANGQPTNGQKPPTNSGTKSSVGSVGGKGTSSSQNSISMKPDDKTNITIKFPLKVKIIMYGLLLLIPFIALLAFVVLFSDEASATGATGTRAYGQTCTKMTVTDTENHLYDGEVEFEDYIAGVVAAESNGITNIEYLKLLAVIVRTNSFENTNSDCTVEGNSNFQNYMDVEDSPNSDLIKQAVSETENMIIVEDDNLNEVTYGYGNIVSEDDTYYYIANGKNEENALAVPKSWADSQSIPKLTEPDTYYDISLISSLYLITNENYTYQSVLENNSDNNYSITENVMILSGAAGFINPTRYIYCSSPFGYRIHPVHKVEKFHSGLDIGISGGEPIFAAADGVVTYARTDVNAINNCDYGYGNYVIIDHGDGLSTLYSHMKYGSVLDSIYVGAEVSQGDQVGQIGSTGCSTGNHLHYEVRLNNEPVDPADYLDLTDAKGTCRR